MKLLPPSMWRSSEKHIANIPAKDHPINLPSRFWRSSIGEPPTKRSQPLEKRKDTTTTITDTVTDSVTETIFINKTVTIFSTTKFFITTNVTFFHTTTITDNFTTTTPTTVSVPFTVSATEPTTLLPPPISSAIHIPSKTKTGAEMPASASASPASVTATPQHHLSTVEILAIVFGILGVLGLAVGVLLLVRRFYRMYRRERVLRKQLRTEGTEMPVMKTGQSLRNDESGGGGGD